MKHRWISVIAAAVLLTGCGSGGPSPLETARSAGMEAMTRGDYEGAVVYFEEAYSLCDEKMPHTKTDIGLYEAASQFKMEDYEGVKNTCSRILQLEETADAYYMRGMAFLRQGEDEAAKADFDGASRLAPANYDMFLNIYREYESLRKSAVGDEFLQKALHYEGQTSEDDYRKGSIYFYLGDYQKAREVLAKPVEAGYEKAMLLMGEVYLAQGDNVHARNIYQQYLEMKGESALAYNGLALCDIADGDYDSALESIGAGLALEADEATVRDLRYNKIVAYEKMYDFEAAKQAASEFAEIYPEDEEGKREYEFLVTR